MTPPQPVAEIAREAAEAISNASRESIKRGDGLPSVNELTPLILSAAAKMVQQSGAVAALESCGEAIYRGDTYQHFDEQKVHAALQSLRSISEGSSGRPNRSIPSPLGGQIGGEPRGSPTRDL